MGSDFLILLFALDEFTDVESELVVRNIVDIILDAIRNPSKSRPQGEIVIGEIARE